MADEFRPRIPMSGMVGPNGEPVYATVTPGEPDSAPEWYRRLQPYPIDLPAALEGTLLSAGMGGNAPGAGRAALEAAAASPLVKALATMGGAGAVGATALAPSEAGEASKDPRIQKLKDLDVEIARNRSILEKQATTNFQSKTARDNAAKPYLDAIDLAQGRKKGIEDQLDAEEKALQNSTFAKSQPGWNAAWPAIQWGGPLAAAMLVKGGANVAERAMSAPWRQSVTAAEKALQEGKNAAFAYNAGKAIEHSKLEPNPVVGWTGDKFRETVVPTAAGGAVGMEASLFPYQYDRKNAPEGSVEKNAAEKALGEDFYWTALKGLAPGVLGGFTGSHMPNVGPGYKPVAETENLKNLRDALAQGSASRPAPAIPGTVMQLTPVSPERPPLIEKMNAGREVVQDQLPVGEASSSPKLLEALGGTKSEASVVTRVKGKDGIVRYHDEKGNFTGNPRKKNEE